ncbi:hypothetical protein [Rhodococcus sp. IEGM 1366]|uniref:hypothetical protein n=1 Tax=Rhodococcus sp. IEGM 1366 TaxID=3082223 RepID=UPI0039892ECB
MGSVAIALDPAASEFHTHGAYEVAGQRITSADMISRYEYLVDEFPLWSIEGGLGEGDLMAEGFGHLVVQLGIWHVVGLLGCPLIEVRFHRARPARTASSNISRTSKAGGSVPETSQNSYRSRRVHRSCSVTEESR